MNYLLVSLLGIVFMFVLLFNCWKNRHGSGDAIYLACAQWLTGTSKTRPPLRRSPHFVNKCTRDCLSGMLNCNKVAAQVFRTC